MLIRSLEQFLACAGCSSNVPYCSSPRSSSALMLLCQLLKSDKLSIFSIASQKATNSLATKLLISMVSFFQCMSVLLQCVKWADIPPPLHSVTLSASCVSHDPFSYSRFTAPSPQKHSVRETGCYICGFLFTEPERHSIMDAIMKSYRLYTMLPARWMCLWLRKLIQCFFGTCLTMRAAIMWSNPWNDLAIIRLITTTLLTRIRRHISCYIIPNPDSC